MKTRNILRTLLVSGIIGLTVLSFNMKHSTVNSTILTNPVVSGTGLYYSNGKVEVIGDGIPKAVISEVKNSKSINHSNLDKKSNVENNSNKENNIVKNYNSNKENKSNVKDNSHEDSNVEIGGKQKVGKVVVSQNRQQEVTKPVNHINKLNHLRNFYSENFVMVLNNNEQFAPQTLENAKYPQIVYYTPEVERIATSATGQCTGNYNKALALYKWVTSNVSYNNTIANEVSAQTNSQYSVSPDGTIADGSDCLGIANLYASLCGYSGIPVKVIIGKTYVPGAGWLEHAWNEIYVNGNWIIVDATRGEHSWRFGAPSSQYNVDMPVVSIS